MEEFEARDKPPARFSERKATPHSSFDETSFGTVVLRTLAASNFFFLGEVL
jgi:hypothetical protein